MNILNIVKKDIIINRLINKGEKVLVALSGGSDSVAMLHLLNSLSQELGFELCAAHINHNIRKEASDDEKFVRNLCVELGIECYVKSVDVLKYAKENSLSSELAGRKIRYDFFEELRDKHSIDKIATAHNKNDSAESILLHLIRGCGISGLSGIPVMRDGYIIRPVLSLTKQQIEEYCCENNLDFVVDKTNFTNEYTRNKIRLELIPLIENEINSNFISTITSNAPIFRETADFISEYVDFSYMKYVKNKRADISELLTEKDIIIKHIIAKMYADFSKINEMLSQKYINLILEQIKKSENQKTLNLPNKISARIEQGFLFFEKTESKKIDYDYILKLNEETYINECNVSILIKEENEIRKNTKDKIYFYINSDSSLHVRNRKQGDCFQPVGMTGTKKLSDLFCDMKIPVIDRDKHPLLVLDDEIIWVTGIRADRRFLKGKKLISATVIRNSHNAEMERNV